MMLTLAYPRCTARSRRLGPITSTIAHVSRSRSMTRRSSRCASVSLRQFDEANAGKR